MHSISYNRLPLPMNDSTESDLSKGARPDNPVNTGVLRNFVQGLKEKIGPDFGRVCNREEEREVKREIARELGVEDDYEPERWPAPDGSSAADQAGRKVRSRYNELKRQGRIEEGGALTELREWNERLNAHLRGEECFFDEDNPHVDWVQEEPSEDPSEGV